MRRWIAIGAGIAAVVAIVGWLRCRGDTRPAEVAREGGMGSSTAQRRLDPAAVARGSIAGTVVDETKRPLSGATVCVLGANSELADELLREPTCATTNSTGTYVIAELLPATYEASAAYPERIPDAHPAIRLRAGERASGVDLMLRGGGVALGGTVSDATGGAIAGALVVASSPRRYGPHVTARTDAQGRFAMWVGDDMQHLAIDADGYASGSTTVRPPAEVAIVLTPEATLAGTVVDATSREPVEDARVELRGPTYETPPRSTFTNARGEFRFRALPPGRHTASASTDHRYGQSAGSWLLGIAQSLTGVLVEVWPGHRVEGRIVGTCRDGGITLAAHDGASHSPYVKAESDVVVLGGVPPGTYMPELWCRGSTKQAALTVSGDVSGLVWNAPPTGGIRGVVRLRDGQPVAGIAVEVDHFAAARTRSDGSFTIDGRSPGESEVSVYGSFVGSERVNVIAGSVVERDLIVEATAAIAGTVVDTDGAPVAGVSVYAAVAKALRGIAATDERGAFRIRNLRSGEYTVLRLPMSNDPGVTVAVRDGEVATVRLTAPAQRLQIRGVVRAGGKPVSEAYVVAAREDGSPRARLAVASESTSELTKPVLTAADGTFTIGKLDAGTYVVRAYRRGGGDAQRDHIAAGTDITLELAPTASITATVRGSGSVEFLSVMLVTPTVPTSRLETFHRTGGRFTVRDLAPGSYELEVEAAAGRLRRAVALAPGEELRLDLELERLVTIVGRFVDLRTGKPLPNVTVSASDEVYVDGITADANGQFRIERVSPGPVRLNWRSADGNGQTARRVVDNRTSTVDLGDVALAFPRSSFRSSGDIGFDVDDELRVTGITPSGPAASSGLEVGDTIVAIDGHDVSGDRAVHGPNMMTAPPGTSISLRVARGATMAITLGPRR